MFKLCVYFLQDRGLDDRNLQPYFLFRDDGFKKAWNVRTMYEPGKATMVTMKSDEA